MAVFGAVIQPLVRQMADRQAELSSGRAVRFQLVRDHPPRAGALLFEKSRQQTPCRFRVAAGLQDFVENVTILINRPPQPVRLTLDQDLHLIQVPDIARSGRLAAQPAGECSPEFQAPAADRFIGNDDPTLEQQFLEQQFLDQAEAQGEAEIQPYRMRYQLARKTVALVTH